MVILVFVAGYWFLLVFIKIYYTAQITLYIANIGGKIKHLRKNHCFIKTIATTKLSRNIIKNEMFSHILVLLCLKHIYIAFSVKIFKLKKVTFYHILVNISLVHVATYDWFWSGGSHIL